MQRIGANLKSAEISAFYNNMRRFILILSRFIFYAAIGWFCFGIGIGAGIGAILIEMKYFRRMASKTQTSKKSIAPVKPSESIIQEPPKTVRIKCKDESIKPVWEKILKDEVFSKQFNSWKNNPKQVLWWKNVLSNNKNQIQTTQNEIIFDCTDLVTFKEIDLNNDGVPEIAVKPKCLFTDGLESWVKVYERKNNGFEILFENDKALFVTLSDEKNGSFHNLYVWSIAKINGHPYDNDLYLDVYNFDGNGYERISRKPDGILFDVAERLNGKDLFSE